jgi:hypothetical protein
MQIIARNSFQIEFKVIFTTYLKFELAHNSQLLCLISEFFYFGAGGYCYLQVYMSNTSRQFQNNHLMHTYVYVLYLNLLYISLIIQNILKFHLKNYKICTHL